MAGMADWQAQITIDVDDLKKKVKAVEGELDGLVERDYKVKLDLDTKTLESAVKKLDKMLDSIGKGSSDFKQFENLSKQLSSITTDIGKISKAFATMDDGSGLVNNIKSIDASLTNLTNHFVSQVSNKMTSSIKEVKGTLSDVGNGKELTPLLDTIGRIELAIDKLSSSFKGIGLNMNIDFGSDKEMEAKAESKISNALQAYQRLFDHIKMSSAGGSIINTKFFDFDINQYDTAMSKLQAYRKFIENMCNEAKAMYGGQDVLYTDTDKKYWTQASSAMGQVTKTFNEMKAASNTNPLENIFGKTDLTEVLNQLTAIISKLDEISVSANKFSDVFKDGLNINASVEEIDKLTNRVKELESELAKTKTPTSTSAETNISLENNTKKNTFQGSDTSASVQKTTEAIKEQNSVLDENVNKVKASINELIKGRDIVSQQWYKEKDTVVGKDSKGNDITRDSDQFSFVERLQNGQLQTVVATLDEKTGQWAEQVVNVRTAFEQVEKAIISADNKINSLENDMAKTLAAHPGYDTTADKALIDSEQKRRNELQATLDLYAQEEKYVYEIEAANKRIAENQQRLQNVSTKQTNLRDSISDEKNQLEIEKQLAKEYENSAKAQQKKWEASQREQTNYENEQKKADTLAKQKAAYDELMNTIKQYSEIAKRVAGGNAKDGDIEKMSKLEDKISQLQKQPILSSSQVKKSEKSLVSLYDQLDKIERKLVETNQKSQDKLINGYDKRLESYTKKESNYKATLQRFGDDGWTSDDYLEKVTAVSAAIKEYEGILSNLKAHPELVTDEELSKLDKQEKIIKDNVNAIQNMTAAQKGYDKLSGEKELNKISQILSENTRMSAEARAKIQAYYNQIESGNPSMSLDKIHAEILKIVNAEEQAGRTGKSLFDIFSTSRLHQIVAQAAGMFSLYDVINVGKQGLQSVRELNTALTEMRKVSDETVQSLKDYQATTFDTADAVGTTAKQIQNSTADWMRLGRL